STNSETLPLPCTLIGCWKNDLGSHMIITDADKKGNFHGFYDTAMKDTPNKVQWSPLRGSL
ncbi:AVID protein, partial [Bucorvus abyssinicus]|nr:AVID protein [Bucorvus abyssinicus]